jgi:GNAT superfamily N-acetyltransferase
MRGVAEMHPDKSEHSTAEVAFSVEPEFRRAGLGSELFRRLIALARELHIDQLRMNCHPQNREMQALARKFNADIEIDRAGNIGRIKTSKSAPLGPVSNARVTEHGRQLRPPKSLPSQKSANGLLGS